MQAPASLLALPILVGALAALLSFDFLPAGFALVAGGAAATAWLAAAAAALDERAPETVVCAIVSGLCCGGSLGASAAQEIYAAPLLAWFVSHQPAEPVVIEGALRADAVETPFGVSMTVDVTSAGDGRSAGAPLGGVRLSVSGVLAAGRAGAWRAGRRVRAPALLRRPAVYRSPGVPDDQRALARRGVVLVGGVKSGTLVEILERGSAVQELAAAVRAWARERLRLTVAPWSARSAAIAAAILIGDRSGLSEEDERRLQQAGTYHVIAISGGNIAMLTVLILAALRALVVPRRPAAALAAALLLVYAQIAGGAASVGRAIAVAVVFLAARVLDHRGDPRNAVAVAALAAIAAAPAAALDPGFVLSFGATVGILIGARRLVPGAAGPPAGAARVRRAVRDALLMLFAATLCAELAIAPIGATLFHRVTFAGLLLNFAAVPLMTVVQIAGAAVLALSSVWPAAGAWAACVTHFAAAGLVESARLVELAPWLSVEVRPPAWWVMWVYYAALLALLARAARRAALLALAAIAVLMFAGVDATSRDAVGRPSLPLRVVVLDVGQGDATVVSLPSGRTLLVDAGGLAAIGPNTAAGADQPPSGFDIGDRVVRPALRALGVRSLAAMVLTHADPDHVRGAPSVLQRVGARSVWEGVPVPPHPGLRALSRAAAARATSWRTLQAGDAERFGDVEVRVLHPPPPGWERQRVRNDDSVVLEIRLGQVSIVLPGDIGREGERAILPRLEPGRLAILKAPHHGSATSSTPELLDRLRPAAVIFSCGRGNRFGHPHPAVVARYEQIGAQIFSTDRDGAVFVETDGEAVEVRGWRGRGVIFHQSSLPR